MAHPSSPSDARQAVISRLPAKVRLTLAFAAMMLLMLSVSGLFVYARFRSQLDKTINVDVRTQASSLLALVRNSDSNLARVVASPLVKGHENFVQILAPSGQILAATPGLEQVPLLSGARLRRALRHSGLLTRDERASDDPLPEGARLLATPVQTHHHGRVVVIVGTSLDQRSSSLSQLILVLAIVGPLALLLASLAAYSVATAALRPVELMQRRAAAVSASQLGMRLPLPPADDEIRRLGVTLNAMLARLEQSFANERSFVANASHELRTPLATLKTELELALRRERPAEELLEALRSAQEEVDRLAALAEDLIVLARADAGQIPVSKADIDAPELLEAVRERLDSQHARVRIAVPAGLRLRADRLRLEQALGNLLDNALRYSAGAVMLSAREAGTEAVELHVEDCGPGFAPGFIDRAFERFSRADPGRAERGSGLGLSIVRMIARAHGGEAHVANRCQGGADAWIVIPGSPGE